MYIYTNHHDSTDLFCSSLLARFRIARFLGSKTKRTIFRSHCLRLRQDPWAKRASTTYLGNSHNYAEAPPGSYNNASRRTPTDQNGLICGNGKLLYVAVIAHIFNSAGHEKNNLAKRPLCVGQLQVNDCLEDDLARLEIQGHTPGEISGGIHVRFSSLDVNPRRESSLMWIRDILVRLSVAHRRQICRASNTTDREIIHHGH